MCVCALEVSGPILGVDALFQGFLLGRVFWGRFVWRGGLRLPKNVGRSMGPATPLNLLFHLNLGCQSVWVTSCFNSANLNLLLGSLVSFWAIPLGHCRFFQVVGKGEAS